MKYKNILIIINPASGKNEPILNVMNDVFKDYKDVSWDIRVTKKFGDAKAFAEEAIKNKVDLIAVYGGDGTLHEVINAAIGKSVPLAALPGGTGNGFATGLGVPHNLKRALLLITQGKTKKVDIAKVGDIYCVSRMYTGIEEDMQTSREMKDKYGTFAYAISGLKKGRKRPTAAKYKIEIDGKIIEESAIKCYIANSGSSGTHISLGNFSVSDGFLDVFTLDRNIESLASAGKRILHSKDNKETMHHWRGKQIKISADKSQPVWIDGEFHGRTPVKVEILPGAVEIITA